MKKKRSLILLLLVLILLLAAYFGLQAWNGSREKKAEEEEKAAEVHVTDIDPDTITAMSFDVGNGEMAFEKEDGAWYYTPDKDFPLAQSYPEDMAETLGAVTADRELTGGDELADYGLADPSYTVEVTSDDGTVTDIYFGNTTGEYYYVTVNDDGAVYTVSTAVIDALNYSLDDMAQLDDYPNIGSGNLVKEVITRDGETTTYDSEDENQAEDVAAVAGGLGAVTLSKAADYSVEDKDLAGYGLDEDSRITVEATYTQDDEENVLTLYIGDEDGSGNRYVMMNASRIVYLISTEVCDNILNS